MKTFLLLFTDTPTRRLLARLRPGRLILASDWVTEVDRASFDECIEIPPPTEVQGVLRALSRVRADAVIAQTEWGVLPGSLLGGGPPPEAAHLCTNKWLSRCTLAKAGVPVPRFALVEDVRGVRQFVDRWPIMLKPVASTGANLVTRVDAPDQLEARVAAIKAGLPSSFDIRRLTSFARAAGFDMACDPTRQFLVEDFAEGSTLETDGLVFGDQVVGFGATEQVVSPCMTIDGYMFPADEADLGGITERAVRAVGLRDTGFSIEFRGGTLIEINGRLGEDAGFADMFHASMGEFPILKFLERDATPPIPRSRVGLAYLSRHEPGVVGAVSTGEDCHSLVEPGEHFDPVAAGPHVAYALAIHPTSSREAHREARARVDRCEIGFAS